MIEREKKIEELQQRIAHKKEIKKRELKRAAQKKFNEIKEKEKEK